MLAGSLDVETSLLVIPSFRTLSGCVLVFVETVLQDLRSIKIFLAPLQTSVDRTLLSSQPDEHLCLPLDGDDASPYKLDAQALGDLQEAEAEAIAERCETYARL